MSEAPNRKWDWLSCALLFVLIQIVAARLVTTSWAPFLYFSETLAAFGTILGLILGASRFNRYAVIALVTGYTLALLPWQATGSVTDKLLLDRFTHIGAMLFTSLRQFLLRQPVKDPFLFVCFAGTVFWGLSVISGYWLVRHGTILTTAIIPFGVTILLIQVYADYQKFGSWWLAVYLLVGLLLIGRGYFLQNQKAWSQRRVFIGEGAWSNIQGDLLTTVAIAILAAWLLPTSISSTHSAAEAWNNFTKPLRERLSKAVSSLNGPYGKASGNFYGTTLPLGQNAAIGDTTVFSVKVLNPPDFSPRYYWRGRVYDTYTNSAWSSSSISNRVFNPDNGILNIPDADNRSKALMQISNSFPTQYLLYAPSQLIWVDRPSNIIGVKTGSQLQDVLSWETRLPVHAGDQYQVLSAIGNPSIQQLQAVSSIYPQWITNSDLQIPDQLRPNFQSLAVNVTTGLNNPFDKANAITDYLRNSIQYSTSLPAAPKNQDPIAWVLFDYKKGFCNYYASAEVLMLRSIGIPARLAVGFAQGEHQNVTYTVRTRDAHAWPEVYFPGVGWVEFEPTVNQDPLIRPTAASLTNIPGVSPPLQKKPVGEDQNLSTGNSKSSLPTTHLLFLESIFLRALIIASILAAGIVLVLLLRRYRIWSRIPVYISRTFEISGIAPPAWMVSWSRWNQVQSVERSFAIINWSLRWLGKPPSLDATPSERAARLEKLLPNAIDHIQALRIELESEFFNELPGNPKRARRASYFIIYYAIREQLRRLLNDIYDHDVYLR